MAYSLGVNDIILIKYFCWDGQQNGVNGVHYEVTAKAGAGQTDQEVADAMSALVGAKYDDYLNVNDEYLGVQAQVRGPFVQPTVKSLAGAAAGTELTDKLPSATALLISTRTALAGRSGRGRCFLPFWSVGHNDADGKPNAAATAAALAIIAVMFATQVIAVGGNSVTIRPVIYSKNGLGPTTPITGTIIRPEWSHQDRRGDNTRPDLKGP